MHGRLKVRTSAEEAIRKKKEHDLKAKAYRNGMDKIFTLRANGDFGSTLLELTGKILSVNPDISTLWNIRRQCLLSMTSGGMISGLFERDLEFTELALQIQPKSYGAWHHRIWVLENSPEPNWEREVKLCTIYLKKDERNFHCWDYRRYVVQKAEISADKELEFCDEKIQKNFSNYSSWHYRSQLLPILHPHETDSSRPISEIKLREELELVITAAFTDPSDSSAWFYQRWLLGYSDPKLDLAAVKVTESLAIVSFTKAVDLARDNIKIEVESVTGINSDGWKSASSGKSDTIWIQKGKFHVEGDVRILMSSGDVKYEVNTRKLQDGSVVGIKCPSFGYEFSAGVMEELRNQLESCNQLLEYEPDSKWTLLTASLLMRSIDRLKYHEDTLKFLEKLEKLDTLRAGYYKDLSSKWSVEIKLKNWIDSGEFLNGVIDLSNLDLTTLYYHQFFAISSLVNLQGNSKINKNSCKFSLVDGCNVTF